jgi:hypothetical protein
MTVGELAALSEESSLCAKVTIRAVVTPEVAKLPPTSIVLLLNEVLRHLDERHHLEVEWALPGSAQKAILDDPFWQRGSTLKYPGCCLSSSSQGAWEFGVDGPVLVAAAARGAIPWVSNLFVDVPTVVKKPAAFTFSAGAKSSPSESIWAKIGKGGRIDYGFNTREEEDPDPNADLNSDEHSSSAATTTPAGGPGAASAQSASARESSGGATEPFPPGDSSASSSSSSSASPASSRVGSSAHHSIDLTAAAAPEGPSHEPQLRTQL